MKLVLGILLISLASIAEAGRVQITCNKNGVIEIDSMNCNVLAPQWSGGELVAENILTAFLEIGISAEFPQAGLLYNLDVQMLKDGEVFRPPGGSHSVDDRFSVNPQSKEFVNISSIAYQLFSGNGVELLISFDPLERDRFGSHIWQCGYYSPVLQRALRITKNRDARSIFPIALRAKCG